MEDKVLKPLTPEEMMLSVHADILVERFRQNELWGFQRHEYGDWLKILIEEVGEVAQAMQKDQNWGKDTDASNLYTELVQVSAVAMAMAEQVAEERRKGLR